jgi:cytochrome bd ubiquinol oxidase subunit I
MGRLNQDVRWTNPRRNSWMHAPIGYAVDNDAFVATDWSKIVFSPVVWLRFPHMLLASYLTGSFCVAATGAWYLPWVDFQAEARITLRMGLYLADILIPAQLFFGHLFGDFVHDYQPAKFAAIEGRWRDEQPASEVLIAIPDPATETNQFAVRVPVLGNLIASMSLTSKGQIAQAQFECSQNWPVTVPSSAAAADALELSIQQLIFLVNVVISFAVGRLPLIDTFAI